MAKLERTLRGDIGEWSRRIDEGILNGSASATLEDASYLSMGGVKCEVRVYERYSALGGNRVSLNVTLLSDGMNTRLSAITSGGSQAVFFKVNTFGERAFLDCLKGIVGG